MDVVIKPTPIGRKAFPIETAEADKLVKDGKAMKVSNRLYEIVETVEDEQVETKKAAPKKKRTVSKKKQAE